EASTENFLEQEVTEAVLGPLGWRAEGRAEVPVLVRGGVLADQVGYGKTAITLGVIDAAPLKPPPPPPGPARGALPVKATLILAPPHLLSQWPREVKKFTGSAFKMLVINTMGDLNRLTVKEVEEADIVVAATSVMRSDLYFTRLADLAGATPLPAKGGRHFNTGYEEAMAALEERVQELQGGPGGVQAVRAAVKAARTETRRKAEEQADLLKGNLGTTAARVTSGTQLLGASKKAVYRADKAARAAAEGGDTAMEEVEEAPVEVAPAKGKAAKAVKKLKGGKGQAVVTAADGEEREMSPEKENKGTKMNRGKKAKGAKQAAKVPSPAVKKGGRTSARAGQKRPQYADDDDDDEEEEWEEAKPKRKPVSLSRPKKAGEEAGADPWGLEEAAVAADWKQLRSAPFELFRWGRVVVDEFTYLTGRERQAVLSLKAERRWCLSGTPPVGNFAEIKSMAVFLGVHLGVDEAPATKKEQTRVERFHFFREAHTDAWHERRHRLAQSFLDRFVRQNVAEIDEIPWEEHMENVQLTPAERALYLELDHHLQAMEMKTSRTIKSKTGEESDREARLKEVLGASSSPEEALLKRASHFDLQGSVKSAYAACEEIVTVRRKQLERCEEELVKRLAEAQDMLSQLQQADDSFDGDAYARWQRHVNGEGCGDTEATAKLQCLLKECGSGSKATGKKKKGSRGDQKPEEVAGAKLDEAKMDLRDKVHLLRRLEKELVGRVRSLRYFVTIRDLQRKASAAHCPACGKKDVKPKDQAVLSCCGHVGEATCLLEFAEKQECPTPGCSAAARLGSVVPVPSLGVDQDHGQGGKFGTKLAQIVTLLRSLNNSERALVFVQFPDLMEKVAEALGDAGIKSLQLKGSVFQKTKALDQFQAETLAEDDPQVLLLNVKDESASGANLTTANHAIFVHPMFTATQHEYTACETQAIGRVRRYGQNRTVHIHRFLVQDSIDTEIFSSRDRTL
ncbi:hypothetical protein CYMTET_52037, partial [Cymbomonas tetramitiformis]